MMEREYNQEKKDMALKNSEREKAALVDQKLDRINFLTKENQRLEQEKNKLDAEISQKISDQEEDYNLDEHRFIEETTHHPEGSTTNYKVTAIENTIKRNKEEIEVIKENLKKIT